MNYKKGIDFIVVVFYRFGYAEIVTESIKKYVKNIPYTINIINNGLSYGKKVEIFMKKTNNSMERYERKWVFDNIDYNQLSILLYRSKFFFSTQFQDREVNSIYFDDQNYSAIKQSVEGVSSKKKYRLRWYGNLNKITNLIFVINKSF